MSIDELERLAKLKESGALTEEEFQAKKQQILFNRNDSTNVLQKGKYKILPDEERKNLSIFKIQKIKNVKEYGGWSHLVYLWVLIPIVAFVLGIVGMRSDNEVKKVQGKAMLLASILGFIWYCYKF